MFESKRHALAYLMGVYLSDGSVRADRGTFRLKVADKEFRDTTASAMEVLAVEFGQGSYDDYLYWVREWSPYTIGRRLKRTFPDGRDHLPFIPDDLARDLVAGIMDGDGGIYHRKDGHYLLQVFGYDDYLADLQNLFAKYRTVMYYRPGEGSHTVNLRSFVNAGFYFRLSRKQALIEAYRKEVMP